MRKYKRRPHGKDWDALTDKLNENFAGKNSKAGEMLARKTNAKGKGLKDRITAKSHVISSRTRHAVWAQVKNWETTQQLISRLETELGIAGAAVEPEEEGGGEEGEENSELSYVNMNVILEIVDRKPDNKPQLGPRRKDSEDPDGDGGGLSGNIGAVMASGIVA